MFLHLITHEKILKTFNYLENEIKELFQKGNVLFHRKHDQEMDNQFFSYMRAY